jgi:hypothetical protein
MCRRTARATVHSEVRREAPNNLERCGPNSPDRRRGTSGRAARRLSLASELRLAEATVGTQVAPRCRQGGPISGVVFLANPL